MKKKNYINLLSMNRYTFCFKLVSAIALVSFIFCTSVVMSANKVAEKKQEIILKGFVRDAHTKKPVSAAQISVPNKNLMTKEISP
jgi:hypothetical protein